jgi:hypothetical protein
VMNEVKRPGNDYISGEEGIRALVLWQHGSCGLSNISTKIHMTTGNDDRLIEETCGDTFLSVHFQ